MGTEINGKANGCTLQWKIENVSHCWWLKGDRIQSPSFIVEELGNTKWSMLLYRLGCTDEANLGFHLQRDEDCSGPEIIEVNFQLAFHGKDGSILKEKSLLKVVLNKKIFGGFADFEKRGKVFVTDREVFLPEDTLTVQCTIWITKEKPAESSYLFATTVFKTKRRSFEWRIDKISTLKSDLKRKFIDNFFSFDIALKIGFQELHVSTISIHESVKYISCNSCIIASKGKKICCGILTYHEVDFKNGPAQVLHLNKFLIENKSRYLPNDVLSLDFEFVFSTVEHFHHRKSSTNEIAVKEKPDCTAILIDEFKAMYNDRLFSDIEIRTTTKTFPAHKAILSSRSAVFSRMFSHDMKEANSGHVEITDFEDDTIQRMLLYIYTASLEDLRLESASKLYKIADKYQILPLKSRCSSFLIENLCPTNACDSLVLADLHHDDDLKHNVKDYMIGLSKHFFYSQEWKDFMNNHNKLAGDVLYRKVINS